VSRRSDDALWGSDSQQLARVARNVATRYTAIIVDGLIGLIVLPFNVRHLGTSAYGLWMLTASVTLYFSVLDLGFGGSMTKCFYAVAATGTAALACYLVTYLAFAVKADERGLYLSKMSQLARTRRTVAAA
jgi:hypothetical protein